MPGAVSLSAAEQIQELREFKRQRARGKVQNLIIPEDEPFPPCHYTINEVLVSQFSMALHTIKEEGLMSLLLAEDQERPCFQGVGLSQNNANPINIEDKIEKLVKEHRKNRKIKLHESSHSKYPLAMAFAYFESYVHERNFCQAINTLKQHIERKQVANQSIILYNLSFLFRESQSLKRAVFYLESTLREKPLFQYAIYDYCFLLGVNDRIQEAYDLLKRHIVTNSALSNSSYVSSMFINLASKLKHFDTAKNVSLALNRKSLNLSNFYNLGLFFKKEKQFQKSEAIFCQILEKYDSFLLEEVSQSSSTKPNLFQKWAQDSVISEEKSLSVQQYKNLHYKDLKIFYWSQIHLAELYLQMAADELKENHNRSKAWKHKSFCVLEKLLKVQKSVQTQIDKEAKGPNQTEDGFTTVQSWTHYKKFISPIEKQLSSLNKEICTESNGFLFQFTDDKQLIKPSKNLIRKQEAMALKASQDFVQRNELNLIQQFNSKYRQKKIENEQRLKYLILKDKELDSFFKTVKESGKEPKQLQESFRANKGRDFKGSQSQLEGKERFFINKTIIQKLRKELASEDTVQKFDRELSQKKLKYEEEFKGFDLTLNLQHMMITIFPEKTVEPIKFAKKENPKKLYTETSNRTEKLTSKESNSVNLKSQRKQESSTLHNSFRIKKNVSPENADLFKKKLNHSKKVDSVALNRQKLMTKLQNQNSQHDTKVEGKRRIRHQLQDPIIENHQNLSQIHVSSRRLDGSQKIKSKAIKQLEGQAIKQIFEAIDPESEKNMMATKTSRDPSRRTSINLLENGPMIQKSEGICEDQRVQIPEDFEELYDKAIYLEEQEKYQQAFDIYMELYKLYKEPHLKEMTLLGLAALFEAQGQYEEAKKTYIKCTKYNSSWQAFVKLGQLLIRLDQVEKGIENLEKANCIKRFHKEIETKLVYAYSLREETTEKALSLANSILKRDPLSLEILLMTAKILEKQGKVKEALDICLAIDCHKESEFIKHYIGILFLSDSNIVEAFKYFKGALMIKNNHVPSLIEIGTILSELRPKEAISILKKVVEIEPENILALARLAKIYESIEANHEQAMEIYRKSLKTKQNYESYMKIGDCLRREEAYLEALVNYKEALNLKKTHEAYRKIAEMYFHKKEYRRSIENYEQTLDYIPKENRYSEERKEVLIEMSKCMILVQDFDSAIAALETVVQNQESKEVYSLLGQGYFGKGEFNVALEYYQKANNFSTEEDTQILESMALCFDKKEEFNASKAIYEKILERDPYNQKCMNNLANVLLVLGCTNQAFYWFELLLEKYPKNLDKRLKVSDIYSAVGDWSKVEYHLLLCYKQKQHDLKVVEKIVALYKEKREPKQLAKFEKKLALLKAHKKPAAN